MASPAYNSSYDEYWYNVSPQTNLPLAGEIELSIDLPAASEAFAEIAKSNEPDAAAAYVAKALKHNPELFNTLRQFIGISDKRAYLDLSYICSRIEHPEEGTALCGCQPWTLARHPMAFFLGALRGRRGGATKKALADVMAKYLLKNGLFDAARGFAAMKHDVLELLYTQLISPKEIQQKEAKRRGHGCEAALARVLEECGATVLPVGKADNPMGSNDLHVDLNSMQIAPREARVTFAFDLLVMGGDDLAVMIQSLIHTSDPGQYGVNKSDETVHVASRIKQWRADVDVKLPELWGLVDGVGFSENKRDTIEKLIDNFDHFLQLATLYKGPLRLHKLGLIKVKGVKFSSDYAEDDVDAIVQRYCPDDVRVVQEGEAPDRRWRSVRAGRAEIYV